MQSLKRLYSAEKKPNVRRAKAAMSQSSFQAFRHRQTPPIPAEPAITALQNQNTNAAADAATNSS